MSEHELDNDDTTFSNRIHLFVDLPPRLFDRMQHEELKQELFVLAKKARCLPNDHTKIPDEEYAYVNLIIDNIIQSYGSCVLSTPQTILDAVKSDSKTKYVGHFLLQYCSYDLISEYVDSLNEALDAVDPEVESDLEQYPNVVVEYMTLCFSLGMIKDRRACPFLHKVVGHFNGDLRWMAVWALGEIGSPESIDVLEEVTDDWYGAAWLGGTNPYYYTDFYDPVGERFYTHVKDHYFYSDEPIIDRVLEQLKSSK